MKTFGRLLAGSFVFCLLVSSAIAGVGQPPNNGPGLIDGTWLNGVIGGQNYTYQYGISGAGTNQATATQLPAGFYLLEIDTAASGTGVALPPCLQGTQLFVYNNGANSLSVYPAVANNPTTSAQDTINSATSLSGGIASHAQSVFSCTKNGVWAAK